MRGLARALALVALSVSTAGCVVRVGHAPDAGTVVLSQSQAQALMAPRADAPAQRPLNLLRAEFGQPPVRRNPALARAARRHAADMAAHDYVSHRGRDGSGLKQRIARAGYASCLRAENIAAGQGSLAEVLADWMRSSGHRRNMLAPRVRDYGLGRSGDHWVLLLATPCPR